MDILCFYLMEVTEVKLAPEDRSGINLIFSDVTFSLVNQFRLSENVAHLPIFGLNFLWSIEYFRIMH